MQKKEEAIPLRRVCINLRKGDYEWLQSTHDQSPSETIRKIGGVTTMIRDGA